TGPLDERTGKLGRPVGKQKRLEGQDRARLLARGDDERGLILEGREDIAQRVARTGRAVQVDHRGVARGLGESIRYADDDRFLQAQNVTEVGREIPKQRQLGGARVAEEGGDTEAP